MAESGQPVDIADLSWEQREKVIRFLFSKMNQMAEDGKSKKAPSELSSALDSPISSEGSGSSGRLGAKKKGGKMPKPLLPALVAPKNRQPSTDQPDQTSSVFITQTDQQLPNIDMSNLPQQVEAT